jgi:hypothetical protein
MALSRPTWGTPRGTTLAAADEAPRLDRTLTVEPGKVLSFRLDNPKGLPVGWWHGHWVCSGSSAGIPGATDDTLVRFTLRGPDNKVVEKLGHPVSGNFDVRYRGDGTYTFEFDNAGIVRSSKRLVRITATFEAK